MPCALRQSSPGCRRHRVAGASCRRHRYDDLADSDVDAVVHARLRVHDIGRLRVVDASIMPTIMSGNSNTPTAMLLEDAR
jgi:choline dehydrogenase-like flavoprotein